MSGSIAWYDYIADDATKFSLKQDSSNALTAGAALSAVGTRTLPRGMRPRYAIYKSQDGLYTRKLYIPTNVDPVAATPSFVITTATGTSVTVNYDEFVAEKEKKSRFNSGQTV